MNYKIYFPIVILTILFFALSCNKDDDATQDELITIDTTAYNLEYGLLPAPDLPLDNQLTEQTVLLGRMLFYEKNLSSDGSQACADCHRQSQGFSDTTRFSIGVAGLAGKRQAMSVFNLAWHSNEFFWDGRAHLLRDQALIPIQDPLEMDETLENVIAKLSEDKMYRDQFTRAFGSDEITPNKMSLALEQFMLTIISNNSKYDQYLANEATLTESEERGRLLFFTEYNPFFPDESGADCAHCHGGKNFENDNYMNNGLDVDADFIDYGREIATGNPNDRAKFKVSTLRNIELTPPYMHDGRFTTLEEVIDHYNSGIKTSSTADPTVINTQGTGLFLTDQDKTDLINFLKTLTDPTLVNNPSYKSPF